MIDLRLIALSMIECSGTTGICRNCFEWPSSGGGGIGWCCFAAVRLTMYGLVFFIPPVLALLSLPAMVQTSAVVADGAHI